MKECIINESRDNRKINQYLIVGNIMFEHINEYEQIEDIKQEISEFCVEAVNYLDSYNANNQEQEDENIRIKANTSKEYYMNIYESITKKRMEGVVNE